MNRTSRRTAPVPPDGAGDDTTKARILDAAGRLFAERGYDGATSKDICVRAGVNAAAVNYHFGGRDRLYRRLLEEANHYLMDGDHLRALAAGNLPPREKLERFLDGLIAAILDTGHWQPRLWAREMMSPSPYCEAVIREKAKPKFRQLARILSEITGRAADDPELEGCLLGVMAPCMIMLVAPRERIREVLPVCGRGNGEVAAMIKRFVFAGVEAFVRPRGRKGGRA